MTQRTYWILLLCIAAILILPDLLAEGMFVDGVIYSSIARNLANGFGSCWFPKYTKMALDTDGLNYFIGHPAPTFWLQALFFKVLGDRSFVENIYTLFIGIVHSFFIFKIWGFITKKDKEPQNGWFPILVWVIIPVSYWCIANNLLENLMSVFCLASIYTFIIGVRKKKHLFIVTSGVFIVFAFLTKGFTGIFPLVAPLAYFLSFKSYTTKTFVAHQSILTLTVLTLSVGLLLNNVVFESLIAYFEVQVVNSISSVKTVGSRFQLLLSIINEIWYLVLVLLIVIFYTKKQKIILQNKYRSWVLFFGLMALFSSLPIMISLKQRPFYLFPSMAYFALVFTLLFHPFLLYLQKKYATFFQHKIWLNYIPFIAVIVALFLVIVLQKKEHRDVDELQIVELIGQEVGIGKNISGLPQIRKNYSLIAYFQRRFQISIDTEKHCEYFLAEKKANTQVPLLYTKEVLKTDDFILYKQLK